jgi:POT family proton-dependent oligopeptide transporter
VCFAPLFAWIWVKLGARNAEPASPTKMALGLLFLAIGYLIIAYGVKGVQPGVKVSMMWLTSMYAFHTFGELCLSPIGLSLVNKLAPFRFASLLMAVWFLANAGANKFAGNLSALYPQEVVLKKEYYNKSNKLVFDSLQKGAIDSKYLLKSAYTNINLYDANLSSLSILVKGEALDSITKIDFNGKRKAISLDKLKLIKLNNKNLDRAVLINEGRYLITHDSIETVVNKKLTKNEIIQVWDLKPEKPSLLGFQINTLYDFFKIFVVMAGVASLILFLVTKKLQKMMA